MKISENLKKVLVVLAVVFGVVLLIRFAGPWFIKTIVCLFGLLSPFIISYIIARIINPIATKLQKVAKIPRGISAVLVMILTLGIIGGLLTLLGYRIFEEIRNLVLNWESVFAHLKNTWDAIYAQFSDVYTGMPEVIQNAVDNAVQGIQTRCIEMISNMQLVDRAQIIAKALPTALIWTIMFILSTYFMVSRNMSVTAFVRKYMGEESADKLLEVKKHCNKYIGGYVKAQLILMVIVFFVILIVLSIFGVKKYVLLIAALTAVLDALPFFGSGIVLWPMAVISFVNDSPIFGIGYIVTYLVIMLLRRFIEPKLVSDGMGFENPLVMLISMYVGYKFWGITGLIIGPLLLMLLLSLYKVGLFNRIIAILKQFWSFIRKEFRLFEKYMQDITK